MRKGTINDIEQLIKGRIFSLIHLHSFIDRLMNKKLDTAAANEVNQYLTQLLAEPISAGSDSFHPLVLSQLLDTIAVKRNEYVQLLSCLHEKDKVLGLVNLNFLLEARMLHSQFECEEYKVNDAISRAKYGFHDRQLYTEILEYLRPHLPPIMAEMKKIIEVKMIVKPAQSGDSVIFYVSAGIDLAFLRKKEGEMVAGLISLYHSDGELREIVDRHFEINPQKKPKWELIKKAHAACRGAPLSAISILDIQDEDESEKEVLTKPTAVSAGKGLLIKISKIYKKLMECHQYIDFLDKLKSAVNLKKERTLLHGVYSHSYDELVGIYQELIARMNQCENEAKKLNRLLMLDNYLEITSNIDHLNEQLITIVEEFNERVTPDITSKQILHIKDECLASLAKCRKTVVEIEQKISQTKEFYRNKAESVKRQQEKEKIDAEHAKIEEARQQRKAALAARKEYLVRERQAKAAQKLTPTVPAENATVDLTEKLVNDEMMQRVRGLNQGYLNMIRSILTKGPRPDIKYNEVCSLIVNQLGGEITEIGNGSSHKRIRLASLYGEMYGCAGDDTAQVKFPVITGGFFAAHKKGHNDRYLNLVHIELLQKLFDQLGLTLALIDEIDNSVQCASATSTHEARYAKI